MNLDHYQDPDGLVADTVEALCVQLHVQGISPGLAAKIRPKIECGRVVYNTSAFDWAVRFGEVGATEANADNLVWLKLEIIAVGLAYEGAQDPSERRLFRFELERLCEHLRGNERIKDALTRESHRRASKAGLQSGENRREDTKGRDTRILELHYAGVASEHISKRQGIGLSKRHVNRIIERQKNRDAN